MYPSLDLHPRTAVLTALVGLLLCAGTAAADITPCSPLYDESIGWMTPFFDDTPGVEGCPAFADQAAIYRVLGYRFDASKSLVLRGPFASARFESYAIDFFDAADERIGNAAVILDDRNETTGLSMTPVAGSCNPATVTGTTSPDSCTPRDFAIVVVHEDLAEAARQAHPDVNVVEVPPGTRKVRLIRRTYLDGPTPTDPPAPSWCDTSGVGCVALGSLNPDIRLLVDDSAFWVGGSDGFGPEDPCLGVRQGECHVELPMYAFVPPDATNPNPATEYAAANLLKLGWSDIAVFTQPRTPIAAVQYPGGALTGDEEVRYWSFCMAVRALTKIYDCVNDFEIAASSSGGAHRLVIGPPGRKMWDPSARKFRAFEKIVADRGDTFLSWGTRSRKFARMLVYRNSFSNPNFEARLGSAPLCDANAPETCIPASEPLPVGIGPWAPRGKHCTMRDYARDTGACS